MAFKHFFKRAEKLDPKNPKDPAIAEWFRGYNKQSPVFVDEREALTLTAFYRAITLISGAISTLPFNLYSKKDGKKNIESKDSRELLISRTPNNYQTSIDFFQLILNHLLLRGRAIIYIESNSKGVVTQLLPLNPDQVKVGLSKKTGKMLYEFRPIQGEAKTFLNTEIIDIRGFSTDGINCTSPINLFAETLGLAKANERFSTKFFGKGASPTGILKSTMPLNDKSEVRLKSLMTQYEGMENSGKTMVLPSDLDFKPLSISPKDAQLLESKTFGINEISRIFGVPAHMLGDLSRATFSNIESQGIEFVQYCLLPLIKKIEASFNVSLISSLYEPDLFFKFNLRGLLRADSAARGAYYTQMRNLGAINANEIRDLEDMNPIEGGDKYLVQLNMTTLQQAGEPQNEQEPRNPQL